MYSTVLSIKNVAFAYKETFLCLKDQPYILGIVLFAPLFNFFISPLFSVTASHFLCLNFILYGKANIIINNGFLYIVATAMALLVVIVTIMNIATSVTIKKRIPEQVIGRVISMIQLCSTISIPLGQLLYGFLADQFSITISYLISTIGLAITFIIMRKTYHMILLIKREEEKC